MKKIKLTRGKYTLVDDVDFIKFGKYTWYCTSHGYAARRDVSRNDKLVYLHSEIMDTPSGLVTDHLNGKKLDNRRKNLRCVTQQENCWNTHKALGKNKYRGVCDSSNWHTKKGWNLKKPYAAKIQINKKVIWLGRYETPEEARRVYLKARKIYHSK